MPDAPAISVDQLYGDQGMTDEVFYAHLDRSLGPRGPDGLFARFGALGVGDGHEVLDAGCRDARQACELARRFGCRVVGVDPVAHNVATARARVAAEDLAERVEVRAGSLAALPCDDASVDFVWCRDVLNHVPDLAAAFRECARVLRPGGTMLAFQTFATELLEPREAARLFDALATVAANMSPTYWEAAARGAGFAVAACDVVASEWREHGEESGARTTSRQLLYVARMRRAEGALRAVLGDVGYATELANSTWGVYQMLAKLCPRIYVLATPR